MKLALALVLLASGCASRALEIPQHADAALPDLATDDLALPDLAAPDLASPDMTTTDLSEPDLAPLPVRLISPLSTSTVTTLRPTLRWTVVGESAPPTVDLCRDRDCLQPLGTAVVDGTGTSAQPDAPLPAGPVFWRARSGSYLTPTWQFWVGARSAPVDTSWGSTLDVNGDGYADVAIGAPEASVGAETNAGRLYIYLGSATGLAPSSPAQVNVIDGPDGQQDRFGVWVSSAGDVNGDGFADLIAGSLEPFSGSPGADPDRIGHVYLYFGGPAGLSAADPARVQKLAGIDGAHLARAFDTAGDVNGDGYADVVVGRDDGLYLFLGGAHGLDEGTLVVKDPDKNTFLDGSWCQLHSAGDVNGDGYGDVILGNGRAWLLLGGAAGFAAPIMLDNPADASVGTFGLCTSGVGDVNGDGYSDVAVTVGNYGASSIGVGFLLWGGPSPQPNALATGVSLQQPAAAFGTGALTPLGDVDADGYADFLVGAYATNQFTGSVFVYRGSASFDAGQATEIDGPDGMNGNFGLSAGAGDFNGDGFADFAVGAYQANSNAGRAHVYRGGALGPVIDPAQIMNIEGPDGASAGFGWPIF